MAPWIGQSLLRKEDHRLLTGHGQYVDDIQLYGTLHAAFGRSTHAHARLSVDLTAVQSHSRCHLAWSWPDIAPLIHGPLPAGFFESPRILARNRIEQRQPDRFPLAGDKVRFVGEPICLVVADSRYAAEDLLEDVAIHYDPLAAVTDAELALAAGAPLVHEELGTNELVRIQVLKGNAPDALARSHLVVKKRFHMQRHTAMPMECRGVLAAPDGQGGLTVWSSNQFPHVLRSALARILGLPLHLLRVIAPDIGGGFGPKLNVYPEDVLVPLAALRLKRPVKWTEDRREHLVATEHAREQVHDIELGLTQDGRITAVRSRIVLDGGAFNPRGLSVPYNCIHHLAGLHHVPNLDAECFVAATNKTPMTTYRGAGRAKAVFAMDRILDVAATALAMDPAEIRRRNLIPAAAMPYDTGLIYRDGAPMVYDSGDYPACFEQALAAIGYADFRRRQEQERRAGRFLGIGLSTFIEGTGLPPFESARVEVTASGEAVVAAGCVPQGQGHETVLSQVCADVLGLHPGQVQVLTGDTGHIAHGRGTYASRSAVLAGNAVWAAAHQVKDRVVRWAATLLEAAESDIVLANGRAYVRGVPDRGVSLAEIAKFALPGGAPGSHVKSEQGPAFFQGRKICRPEGLAAGLEAIEHYEPETLTFANGVHAVILRVDPESGEIQLLRYVVVHDCGRMLNPMIVEGQVAGGVVQGIGGALGEHLVYDEQGQLLSGTLMDYLVPVAAQICPLEVLHHESPSTRNPLGIKGCGEAGAISPPAAIAGAVEDALRPWGVTIDALPITPDRVRQLLRAAQAESAR